MKDFVKNILIRILKLNLSVENLKEFYIWQNINNFSEPLPQFVKEKVFNKYNLTNSVWIETGTYLGKSTKYLSQISDEVFSLEPDKDLYEQAKIALKDFSNIKLINKTSENGLEEILKGIKNENLCFWLDGHYSGGITFKGDVDTPILEELRIIEKYIKNFKNLNILIDDFRLFEKYNNSNEEYPDKSLLIKWVEDNGLRWTIQSDIFIVQKINKN